MFSVINLILPCKFDYRIAAIMKLTHVRLDRENIGDIDNLEMLGPVTNVYLQWVR